MGGSSGGPIRQYFIASFLGVTPGCLGAFMNVSFYIRGLLTLGALLGGMIATSGDEAFIMLSLFPGKALFLFGILFIIGIIFGYITDKLLPFLKIQTCQVCRFSEIHKEKDCRCYTIKEIINSFKTISFSRFLLLLSLAGIFFSLISGIIGPDEWNWKKITLITLCSLGFFIIITVTDHFLEEHIWNHIIKKHIWKVFLWSFAALLIIEIGLQSWNFESFIKSHIVWVMLIAGILAIIPQSGPQIFFIMLFSKGIIPFSVLLTSSIIQNGHGMLPLLSYSIKDSLIIKLINFIIGITLGYILFFIGY